MTSADVQAFLDGLVPVELRREDVAGAVIVVVKDGQAYGNSDVAQQKPVLSDGTLFRPGSVSKLIRAMDPSLHKYGQGSTRSFYTIL
jgi:CubicO group peptidase (beta-lactamase class C family)